MATFLSLPLEDVIFPQILSRLTPLEVWSLRLVSQDFYSIVYQYYATSCHKADFIKPEELNVHIVYRILAHCQRLKQLRLNGDCLRHHGDSKTKGDCILLSLKRTRPSLSVLHLQSLLLSGTAVDILMGCCKDIEILSLIDITVEGKSNGMSNVISDDCSSLEEIRIVDSSFSHHRLQRILPEQKGLKILEVQKTLIITLCQIWGNVIAISFMFMLCHIKVDQNQNLAQDHGQVSQKCLRRILIYMHVFMLFRKFGLIDSNQN